MSALGLPIAPVIDRIKTQVPELRLVAGTAELVTALEGGQGVQSPSAYVALAREDAASPVGASGGVLIQQVNVSLGVVLCVRNYKRADLGGAAGADLESIRDKVRAALLNWLHPAADLATSLQTGSVRHYDKGTLWWQDIYRTRYRIEASTT